MRLDRQTESAGELSCGGAIERGSGGSRRALAREADGDVDFYAPSEDNGVDARGLRDERTHRQAEGMQVADREVRRRLLLEEVVEHTQHLRYGQIRSEKRTSPL